MMDLMILIEAHFFPAGISAETGVKITRNLYAVYNMSEIS